MIKRVMRIGVVISVILFALMWYGVTAFRIVVPTGSMLPTIQLDESLVVLQPVFVKEYKRGDIVVFYCEDDPDTLLVKRLIGLPGEIVDVRDGAVYVDGEPLYEEYLGSNDVNYSGTFFVPEDCYLFFGDNRAKMLDTGSSLTFTRIICRVR